MQRNATLLALLVFAGSATLALPSAAQTVSTVAGTGVAGDANGPAAAAQFDRPYGVAADSAGNLYVAEPGHHGIRRISPAGTVSNFAGSGFSGYYNSPIGTDAIFTGPQDVLVAPNGDVLVADSGNGSIRRINGRTAAVSTLAGTGRSGFIDGPVAQAQFRTPVSLAFDGRGNLYVADADAYRLRKIAGGVVSTVAGSGVRGYLDGPAASARFWGPTGVATDNAGNVYIADGVGQRIRKFDPLTNTVSTLAGTGTAGYLDGPLTGSRLSIPYKLAYSAAEHALYVLDQGNFRVRRIDLRTATIRTVAGDGQQGFADGPALTAQFDYPAGLALAGPTTLVIGDALNHRIRRVSGLPVVTHSQAGAAVTDNLSFYPNPSSTGSTLRYRLAAAEAVAYTVYDMTGRVVRHVALARQSAGWHTCAVATTDLPAGVYLLRLSTTCPVGSLKFSVCR